jgi:hypothetical protein
MSTAPKLALAWLYEARSRLSHGLKGPASTEFSGAIRENLYVAKLDPAGTIYFRERD